MEELKEKLKNFESEMRENYGQVDQKLSGILTISNNSLTEMRLELSHLRSHEEEKDNRDGVR